MKPVPVFELLNDARKRHYAVGAFNVLNLEMVQAVVRAARSEDAPVIIQVWHAHLKHAGAAYIGAIVRAAAERSSIPLALQLDHGQDMEQIKTCIEHGFTSVMIDISTADYDKNIAVTREAVQFAHSRGVSVEAELGKIFSGRDTVEKQKSSLTDPGLAAEFVEKTGVDALAVSIGTAHGEYLHGPDIDFELLEQIINTVDVPIVIHGASGTPDDDILKMIKLGVAKINVGTEIMNTFLNGLKEIISGSDEPIFLQSVMNHARECMENVVGEKIRLFNSFSTL